MRPTANATDALGLLNRGYYVVAGLSVVFMIFVTYVLFHNTSRKNADGTIFNVGDKWFYFALAGLVGIAASVAFVYITQYYTAGNYRPGADDRGSVAHRVGDEYHLRPRDRFRIDRDARDHDLARDRRRVLPRHAHARHRQ